MNLEPKQRIAGAILVGLSLATAYVLMAPAWYSSTLSVVPAAAAGKGPGTAMAAAIGADLPIDLGNSLELDRIVGVLQSRSVTDAVIAKFDLTARYRTGHQELTRKKLWRLCSTHVDKKAKIVSLTCEDHEPAVAQAMVAYFGEVGNEVFRRVNNSGDHEEALFLERRIGEVRKEADEAGLRLREFEERHQIIDLEAQSKAVVATMASLRGQEISKELQLSYMKSFTSGDEATASQLRQQLDVIDGKFRTLDDDTPPAPSSSAPAAAAGKRRGGFFPSAMAVPRLQFELSQLVRDRKIYETHLMLLMQRLEQARLNEARDTSAYAVLDSPSLATVRSHPVPEAIVLLGALLGLLTGLGWAMGPAWLRSLRAAADAAAVVEMPAT